MKSNRIRYVLIPLFLLFGIFVFCSLSVYAAPTAPNSVNVTLQKDGVTVTKAAKGSKITIIAQANGGTGDSYQYSFQYKKVGGGSWNTIRDMSAVSSVDFTLAEEGGYTVKVNARTKGSDGESPPVSKEVNITSVAVTNTSTISSTAISLGEKVDINASATGGSSYEYYYSVSKDGGSNYQPISPSSGTTDDTKYVKSAACSYTPASAGTYDLRVVVKDKETGAYQAKVFTVTATAAAILNKCDIAETEVEITGKAQSVSLIFGAEKGKSPYKYRCSYIAEGTGADPVYLVGDETSFASVGANRAFKLTKVGSFLFSFEVEDANGTTAPLIRKRLKVTTNLNNTSSLTASTVSNQSGFNIFYSATGGTGEYEFKSTYQFEGDAEKNLSDYEDTAVIGIDMPTLLAKAKKDSDFTGNITFKTYVRDKNIGVVRSKEFEIDVTVATAAEITRQDLMGLLNRVNDWEMTLTNKQRKNLYEDYVDYVSAKNDAENAVKSDIKLHYEIYYNNLLTQYMILNWPNNVFFQEDDFWMTKEVNKAKNLENSVIKGISGWFSTFSGVNIDTNTFKFNIEDFVDQFSKIFVIFASSLLVLLFGVNIIRTALEYQLFTLKGFVTTFGKLFLAEILIQLSTKICVMIVKIFNELMASILAAIDASGLLNEIDFEFNSERSGVWLIGDIVDFFVNLIPFLLVMLLFCIMMIIFIIVYIKLIIRSFEIAMLSVVSPVFFACSVGEATMPYFKKFISAFLAVGAEIVFMAVVYLAFLWYCKEFAMVGEINLTLLYSTESPLAGQFYTYCAVTVACGIMMIKPPQVLKDLMR